MPFIPYLNFAGRCAEAFAFYGEVFGGTPEVMLFRDAPREGMPPIPPEREGWAIHAQLACADGVLMGSDAPPEFGGKPMQGVSVSVSRRDPAEAQALFARLAEGGTVTMPFGETFFSPGFGMCVDRFGTSWMISVEETR